MKQFSTLLFLLAVSSTAWADALGGSIGANIWAQQYDAKGKRGGDFVDFSGDFDVDDEADYEVYASFEHPIPLIPNVRAQHTESETDGKGILNGVTYNGQTFDGPVTTELSLTHSDATAYYEILDNWINLDLGITARFFDGDISLTSEDGVTVNDEIDDVIPMLYVAARFDLPFTGWQIKASGNWVNYDDDDALDARGALAWESPLGLGVELGYRYFDIDYDFGSTVLESTVDGVYGGLFWDF